jgi:hypothetical protein
LGQAGAQIAGAASNVQNANGTGYAGKADEQGRKAPAPAAHLQFIRIAICGNEG